MSNISIIGGLRIVNLDSHPRCWALFSNTDLKMMEDIMGENRSIFIIWISREWKDNPY